MPKFWPEICTLLIKSLQLPVFVHVADQSAMCGLPVLVKSSGMVMQASPGTDDHPKTEPPTAIVGLGRSEKHLASPSRVITESSRMSRHEKLQVNSERNFR